MSRLQRIEMAAATIGLAAASVLSAACSGGTGGSGSGDGGTGGVCAAYVVPAGTDLTQPAVAFQSEVMTLFTVNCSAAACHGTPLSGPKGLFLGAQPSDAAAVYTGLVGRAGDELPSMPFVTAGDPSTSYLMHKLDGDQCLLDAQCATGTCLVVMPSGLGPLPLTMRDTVRRWIAQGAKND